MKHLHAMLTAILVVSLTGCGGAPSGPGAWTHKPPPDDGSAARGHLAPEEIRKVMQQTEAGFNNCFGENQGNFVSGDARLSFVVGDNGRVRSLWVSDATLGSWRVEDCLVQTARFLEFPPPSGDKSARFAYPFAWNAAGVRLSTPVEASFGYEALRSNRSEVSRCREAHGYRGPFYLTIYVGRLGQVLSAGFHSSAPPQEGFSACMVQAVEAMRFPNPGSRIVKFQVLVEDMPDWQ